MKKLPKEVRQTLKDEIEFYLDKIDELDEELVQHAKVLRVESGKVLSAYYLSGIYSCIEDIFEKIAKVFENRIENAASWHSELLLRMRISINGIRPAIISEDTHRFLDEFRAFRHVFRSSYMFSIDSARLELLFGRWREHKEALVDEIRTFLKDVCVGEEEST